LYQFTQAAVATSTSSLLRLAELALADVGISWAQHRIGPVELSTGATAAATEIAGCLGGRAVVYPGVDGLIGEITVQSLLAGAAINRIVVLAGQSEPAASDVPTRGHVRPEGRDGLLTLAVMPAPDGAFVPFEVPNPTPCCADHA
jgi:hypothetical protein